MSDNIQEAEVGSGTKISDTKQSEKRAQLTLKAIQLRLKQEKERAALQQQKKSLSVKEDIGESFSPSQIAALKAEYSKINGIDPDSDTYKKLIAMLDRLDLKTLQSLAGAEIKFVSKLAQNRVLRKSMKKEEVHEANIQPTSAKSRSHISNLSHSVTNSVTHPSSGKEIGIITKQSDGKYYAHTSSVKLSHSQGKVFDTKDQAHQYIRDAHAKAIKTGTLSDRWKKQEKLPQFSKEEVQLDEISTKLLAKAAHAASDPDADYHYGKSHDPQKFADRAKKTKDAKSAAAVQGAADAKGHYTRPGHSSGSYDKLAHRSPARVTSAGKANKQDVNKLKGNIKRNEEVESIDELSTNKLTDYKKKAGENASAADKAGDTKTGNKRFSGIMKATRKQFDNDAKQKTEELSSKQKAMDKNKNGKIDGSDLAKLRGEELSAKQKVLDKNKNGKIDGSDLAKLRKEETDLQEKSDYEVYHKDYSGAVQAAIKQAEKRGYEVDMDDWHDKVATGPKKPSSGKTNSFSINLMKDGKPAKKKLQMQVYNMDNHKYELNMYIEEIQLEEMTDGDKSSIALQAMVARKKLQQTAGKNKSQSFIDKMTSKANAGDRLPKKPADEYDRKVVKYLKKKHGMSEASVAETYEGVVDKIKAIKRGMQAKAKADDHFDKAGDPKNANASKDLKKAVRYQNLLNKEEVVLEAKKSKTFKNIKKKMKEEETPNKATIKKGDMLTGKREPIEINPELKEPGR